MITTAIRYELSCDICGKTEMYKCEKPSGWKVGYRADICPDCANRLKPKLMNRIEFMHWLNADGFIKDISAKEKIKARRQILKLSLEDVLQLLKKRYQPMVDFADKWFGPDWLEDRENGRLMFPMKLYQDILEVLPSA